MRNKSVVRRVLLPFALVIGVFAVSVPGAQAVVEHHYAGTVLQPGQTWNSGESAIASNITGNIAAYEGSGTVSVCQRTFDFTSNVYREGCANNNVGNALNLMSYYGHELWAMVKNNSAWAHTIQGWYYTG